MNFSIAILLIIQFLVYFYLKDKRYLSYNAVQKIHDGEIPRIGGLIFFIGLLFLIFFNFNELRLLIPLLLGSTIILLFSLYEDIRQSLSPFFRLVILFLGSSIFILFTELPEINVRYLDFINQYSLISFLIFTFSLMLLMNGFNFIDGLNGLSSFNFYSILFSAYYLAAILGDAFLVNLVIIFFLSSILVFILNFPLGRIFIGDSGSYLYAFYSGALVIYLFSKHDGLPTLLALIILAYPITEMLFSIIRKIIEKKSPMQPDTLHLHHLIFLQFSKKNKIANNLSSLLMLTFSVSPFVLCYLSFNNRHINEELIFLIYFIAYSLVYLVLRKKSSNL
jgi:UDP-N-acetylmuramyl pentapeptide phosphotransferase/UDP-N-acetylglucosamine-1-phosphate transferase